MTPDANKSPFQICRDRVWKILEGFFDDIDGVVCDTHDVGRERKHMVFGVICRESWPIVPIGEELWRDILTREWEESHRNRPLRGHELELVLYSLAERGAYSRPRGGGGGWQLTARKEHMLTAQPKHMKNGIDGRLGFRPNDTRRSREKRALL